MVKSSVKLASTLLFVLMTCVACGPTQIMLQNPKTGEVVKCAGDPWANWNVAAATQSCADGYEKVGYVPLSKY